jgi:hypothetical protein
MQKTISAPCGAAAATSKFTLQPMEQYPAPIKLVKDELVGTTNNAVILSPTNVNNTVVTRQLKLVNLDSRQGGGTSEEHSIRSNSQDSGVNTSQKNMLLTEENQQPVIQVKKKFEKIKSIRAKFSMKRTSSKVEFALDHQDSEKLLRTKTQMDVPRFTSKQTQKMKRTVTAPDAVDIVSYISPPLGDFRHTAHLGHHGESFGDLSFLNSTKIEYTDKNAGLRAAAVAAAQRKSKAFRVV